MTDSILNMRLTGEHILVKVRGGTPFAETEHEPRLIHAVTFGKEKEVPPCWGIVVVAGPHPYIKDDCTDKEDKIKVGDVVVFPPTSGFKVPGPEESEDEYRLMAASVVAGMVEPSAKDSRKRPQLR